jgi:hypothetical protein
VSDIEKDAFLELAKERRFSILAKVAIDTVNNLFFPLTQTRYVANTSSIRLLALYDFYSRYRWDAYVSGDRVHYYLSLIATFALYDNIFDGIKTVIPRLIKRT